MVYYPQVQNRMAGWAPAPHRRVLGQQMDVNTSRGRENIIAATTSLAMLGAATWAFSEMGRAPKKSIRIRSC